MRRREFIRLIAGATAACPFSARAQQSKVHRIGFLANDPTIPNQPAGQAFLDGLRENGFIEGKNIVVERRFAEGRMERYAGLVAELIKLNVDVMVTSAEATYAAKEATKSIPIVMLNVTDPVGLGLVGSLAHPGSNVTGLIQDDSGDIAAKRLQFLNDAVSQIARVAVLMNPDTQYTRVQLEHLEIAARILRKTLRPTVARQPGDFEDAFADIQRDRCDSLFVAASGLNFVNRKRIVGLATASRLPTMFAWREATQDGGLMSYGNIRVDQFHGAGIYVSKILNGAKPADLPLEGPTRYELLINLKTAKTLNLEIPRSLLLIANEVIE
jgi:putative tryptophan/tyrosine transport system substrate-binding protein